MSSTIIPNPIETLFYKSRFVNKKHRTLTLHKIDDHALEFLDIK